MTNEIYYSYIGVAVITVLIILVCVQITNKKPKPMDDIMVYTPKGLVQTNSTDVLSELSQIRDKLLNNAGLASETDEEISDLINESIYSLSEFIKKNPRMNSAELCQLDTRSDAIQQAMDDSVSPNPLNWQNEYKTILNWENEENEMQDNPRKRLIFLIKHIDIAINMLNMNVCDNGRLNLTKLYMILQYLNKKIHTDGTHYLLDGLNDKYCNTDLTKLQIGNENNKVQMYQLSQDKETESIARGVLGSIMPMHREGFSGSLGTKYTSMTNSDPFNDGSIEGSVEHDIVEQQNPGSNLGLATDTTRFTTALRNACLGNSPSDEELWKDCVMHDVIPMETLHGTSNALICDLN